MDDWVSISYLDWNLNYDQGKLIAINDVIILYELYSVYAYVCEFSTV